jgi:hypothetical protein
MLCDDSSTLTVDGGHITGNRAIGGEAGAGGGVGQGMGGGVCIEPGGVVFIASDTALVGNHASTSGDDVFGSYFPTW